MAGIICVVAFLSLLTEGEGREGHDALFSSACVALITMPGR